MLSLLNTNFKIDSKVLYLGLDVLGYFQLTKELIILCTDPSIEVQQIFFLHQQQKTVSNMRPMLWL